MLLLGKLLKKKAGSFGFPPFIGWIVIAGAQMAILDHEVEATYW